MCYIFYKTALFFFCSFPMPVRYHKELLDFPLQVHVHVHIIIRTGVETCISFPTKKARNRTNSFKELDLLLFEMVN